MSDSVVSWWLSLCAVAVFNVVAWWLSATALQRRKGILPADLYAARRLQLQLSAVYVFGCAFRSVFPVFDVPRLCLVNTWLSSVVVGRSVATCAELCFAAQWALLLREAARTTGSLVARSTSRMILPLIVIAETCSWYSVLTTNNIGHTAEESLWGISAALFVIGVAVISSRCARDRRALLILWCAAGAAYVAFMLLVDVPMYWSRWISDGETGRHYLTLAQGVHDVTVHRVVSYHWTDWKREVPWMSLYFSVGVWLSITLIHAPTLETAKVPVRARRPRYVFSWMTSN